MQLNTYIFFDGTCEEAMTAYAKVLGGKLNRVVRFRDMAPSEGGAGPNTPPGWDDKIMHMRLDVDGRWLMASDAPPERRQKAGGFYVQLEVPTPEEAGRVYAALKDGGNVIMELQEMPWAQRFAMIVDRYGTPWMINCDRTM